MAQQIADTRDVDFVLYEQLEAHKLADKEKFAEFNKKTFELLVKEARNFAIKEILPTFEPSDREGAVFDSGKVTVPECFHKVYKMFVEGEWVAMTEEPEVGGQGFPATFGQAALEYILGANFGFSVYPMAGHGTAKMIEIFGTDRQKELYMKKLYTGEWGGTMVLTESEAGSDVGNLSTTAVKNEDGTYSITGNKIFISNAEQDLTDNIVHPVLARIEGEPAGTKGISIFIISKFRVNEDGTIGESNDVVCTGIEEKMGLHGSSTCQLSFGGKGQCQGELLGEVNKGMRVMFYMMNEARLMVGALGMCQASAAYLHALNYAKERLQGRDLLEFANPDAPMIPIIGHPDVKRTLMWMKTHVEGMRSLCYFCGWCFDTVETSESEEEKEQCQALIEILTPVIKAYCTDRGFQVCVEAMQVYGGYGYTKDFPVEQILRDSKINSIYEGTNGIQAMDLLGRKMAAKGGAYFMALLKEVKKTTTASSSIPGLENLAAALDNALDKLSETAMALGKTAMSEQVKTAFAHATPFQEALGDVCMAWMLLWRAQVAAPALEKALGSAQGEERAKKLAKNKETAFYAGQVQAAKYFIETILPVALGRLEGIRAMSSAVMDIPVAGFGG